jgi:hypothetical protein
MDKPDYLVLNPMHISFSMHPKQHKLLIHKSKDKIEFLSVYTDCLYEANELSVDHKNIEINIFNINRK